MRKTKEWIAAAGRDKGRVYLLTEWSARKFEKWGWKLYLAMARSGISVPDDVAHLGTMGVLLVGLRSLSMVHWHDAEPLLDELLDHIQIRLEGGVIRPASLDGDFEEWETIVAIRQEVVELNLGFTIAEGLSRLQAGATGTTRRKRRPSQPMSPT